MWVAGQLCSWAHWILIGAWLALSPSMDGRPCAETQMHQPLEESEGSGIGMGCSRVSDFTMAEKVPCRMTWRMCLLRQLPYLHSFISSSTIAQRMQEQWQ